MIELNCLNDYCPIPLMKLQTLDSSITEGDSVLLITDHSCVCESILSYCGKKHYNVRVFEPMNGIWELTISK